MIICIFFIKFYGVLWSAAALVEAAWVEKLICRAALCIYVKSNVLDETWPKKGKVLVDKSTLEHRKPISNNFIKMDVLCRPAEEFGNDETVEHLWAAKAMEHSDIYFNVLCSVDTKYLRITSHDDLIYTHFRQDFPDLDVAYIKEDEIKNNSNKVKWRSFCEKFKNIIEDYSFGTLLRADTKGDYSEQNTILVPRVQFYAIEIARNREGLNNEVKKKFKCASKVNVESQKQQKEIAA